MHPELALKLLWRDWRAGELTLLLASLVIAVTTVTTIALFADRLQKALLQESATFLAADRVISSSSPIDSSWLDKADELGLQRAQTLSFLSMVFSADRAQFSSVKAVDDHYPLRGELIVSDAPFVRGHPIEHGPKAGEVWMESRLYPSLDVQTGDILDVGVAGFPASRVLIKEPDRGGGFSNIGPRVLMNLADVTSTEVVQPGSRLTYRYLFAGEEPALVEFERWVKPKLGVDEHWIGVRQGAEGIGSALDRAERFLLLGGLLGVVLAGVAIALAAQRYSLRHYDHVAILKTLGATPAGIDSIFIIILLLLGLVATLLGSVVGFFIQTGITSIMYPWIPVELPAPGLRGVWLGLITGFICLLSFALPPLLKLRTTDPVRVIRRDMNPGEVSSRLTYSFAVLGTIGLMWWYSQNLLLTLLLFTGALVVVVILSGVAYIMLHFGRVLGMQAGSSWRLAVAGMQRRARGNTLQIMVFGFAIMLLLILYLVRTALVADWQGQIPEGTPNHFAINIAPEEVASVSRLFKDNNVRAQPLYPMIQGRITTINGESVRERNRRLWRERRSREEAEKSAGGQAGKADIGSVSGDSGVAGSGVVADKSDDSGEVGEGFEAGGGGEDADGGGRGDGPGAGSNRNLTWSNTLPDDNRIEEGKWWPEDYAGTALVSLEQSIASRSDINVGDELNFTIHGGEISATVGSIRSVAWDNMQPNFYIIFSPGGLEDFPSTWMTSFFLAPDEKLFLNTLLNQHPTMTVIEIDAVLEQIQNIISQVTLAIELMLILILVSGVMVLLASIQASMDERFQQQAILRALGAGRRLVLGSLVIEFCILGCFAGLLATLGSEITVYALETEIFELDYSLTPELWLIGPVTGTVLIGVVGILATLKVINTPPSTVLREL